MEYSYDELYGVSIKEYCKLHNTTIENLITKNKLDIKILRNNLKHIIYSNNWINNDCWNLIKAIRDLIEKKEKHLKRLKQWKKK